MRVWGVHVVKYVAGSAVREVGAVESIHSTKPLALEHALERSRDTGVWAAAVTSWGVDELGTRDRVALYMNGVPQRLPYRTDNQEFVLA